MRIERISANRLEPTHLAVWREILAAQPTLDSPFFTPEFTQVVASVRPDVEVGLMYASDRLVGFFPFQRTRLNAAVPVGAGFSEFHGVIAAPGCRWSVPELLRGCGVLAWKYDHVPVAQEPFAQFHQRVGPSPFVHLADGFGAYCDQRKRYGSSVIRRNARKLRKLEREVGPVQFELHDSSGRGLEKLLEWKSAQHARTRVVDVFRRRWVTQLLRRVHDCQGDALAGMMSVLSVGARPIAVHLGMRTGSVAHMWYPAYDPDFGGYSPGMILFLELARVLADQGVQRMDLGPGPQRYKQSLRSGDIEVALGTADRYWLAGAGRQAWRVGRERIRAYVRVERARAGAR